MFDIEALNEIPIQRVIEALGGRFPKDREPSVSQYNMHCCNSGFHNNYDNKPSMTVWKEINSCICHVCGTKGKPVSIATAMLGDFKEACTWLHDTFNIPYKNGYLNNNYYRKPKVFKKAVVDSSPKYLSFEPKKRFKHIEIKEYVGKYEELGKKQRLKLLYTFIYRYSLTTKRDKLLDYYKKRGIKKNPHLDKIGFLSKKDVDSLMKKLLKVFPAEDLVEFGVINDTEHKSHPLEWKNLINIAVIPSFDIYTDLVEGFMLRPVDDSNAWFKGKEKRLSVPSIAKPLPFGIGFRLLSKKCDIYITEGHIDALSLPSSYCFIAAPGVNTFEDEQLGLLKGRNIKLVFDQDEAGQKAAWGYFEVSFLDQKMTILKSQKDDLEGMKRIFESQGIDIQIREHEGFRDKLLKAGAKSVEVVSWDSELGKDVNELLLNKHLDKVFKEQPDAK